MLRHKRLGVVSEDQVVVALSNWLKGPSVQDEHINQIVCDVNWNYVSLPYLLDLAQSHPKLRANFEFYNIFETELKQRLFYDIAQKVEEPRFSYKYCFKNLPFDIFRKELQKEERELLRNEIARVK